MCVLTMARLARRIKGTPLPQWFWLDPWEFVNLVNYWIERGDKWVYLEGVYRTSTGRLVALDLEQPAPKDLNIQERINGIACFCGHFGAFSTSRGWNSAWVQLPCRDCERCWYCGSGEWQGICFHCELKRYLNQGDFEPKVLKLVGSRIWYLQFGGVCEKRIGNKL